jgi:hypothetical protein
VGGGEGYGRNSGRVRSRMSEYVERARNEGSANVERTRSKGSILKGKGRRGSNDETVRSIASVRVVNCGLVHER